MILKIRLIVVAISLSAVTGTGIFAQEKINASGVFPHLAMASGTNIKRYLLIRVVSHTILFPPD
jgi:hypothetical protein